MAGQTRGRAPLFAASRYGHMEVVRALVGAGAAVNQADVRYQRVMPHWYFCGCAHAIAAACSARTMFGCLGCFGHIVSVAGQTGGVTPLFAASRGGHIEAVTALVGAGAAVNQAAVREFRLSPGGY